MYSLETYNSVLEAAGRAYDEQMGKSYSYLFDGFPLPSKRSRADLTYECDVAACRLCILVPVIDYMTGEPDALSVSIMISDRELACCRIPEQILEQKVTYVASALMQHLAEDGLEIDYSSYFE